MQFLNYFKALLRSPVPKSKPITLFIASYALFFFSVYIGGASGMCLTIPASISFMAGIMVCYYCNSTPNIESVFPVNHKKKLAYRFLSSLLLTLIIIAVAIAVALVVFLIAVIITFIAGGISAGAEISEDTETFGEVFFKSLGVYGGLMGMAFIIIMYSSGMIVGFIKNRKYRNIYLVCLCLVIILSFLLMIMPYFVKVEKHLVSAFSQACFNAMSLPWLCIGYWFVFAAVSLGVAIYLGIKHYNPKKF